MRRKDKELADPAALEDILKRGSVCRLALVDDGQPYLVPMSYGYVDGALYLHSAAEGRKINILRNNSRVCFEVEVDVKLVTGERACNWSFHYRSVIGYGRGHFVTDPDERRLGIDAVMRQYGASGPFDYAPETMARTVVIRIEIEEMTGKQAPPKAG